jgi:fumarate hydratase, class I
MTTIQQDDLIESIRAALQYISFYHPIDYIENLTRAYELEQSPAAKDAMKQILVNSRMCAEGHRPICQDTGIVNVFLKVGLECHFMHGEDPATMSLQQMCDEGVREAWLDPDNRLRGSILADPAFSRKNTKDNTPCVVEVALIEGNTVEVTVAAKGGGSEAKSRFVMLNPSDSIADWVLKTIPTMGAGWCPPGILGIGVGGTAEKAMLLAKQSLMAPIDMQELKARGPKTNIEKLRVELHDKINALGIGAQGLGGLTTVLDVKIVDWPAHAANLPVAMIPNCAAMRDATVILRGEGPVYLDPPSLDHWPKIEYDVHGARRVNLDTLTHDEIKTWKLGEVLLLNGKLLTGRDAAHKRLTDMMHRGEPLPVDFTNRIIYYVGPVDAVRDEAVGPAGPTTATRMDKFTREMLERTGLLGMIGKAERGVAAIDAIRDNQAVYLIAIGGAAYLVSKAIKHSRLLAFEDLGMEAIYEFEVVDMPVTVAVDTQGHSVHTTGPAEWKARIAASMEVGGVAILGQ